MSCTTTAVMTSSHEEPVLRSTYGTFTHERSGKRRHSFCHTRSWSFEHDNVNVLVDRFLVELNRRLDFLEAYGHLKLDNGIECAYSTLVAVRDACANISDNVIDAGWRKTTVLVDILEETYKDALAKKETLEQKVQESLRLMEGILSDFEAKAYTFREAGIFDSSWRRVDEGLDKARWAKESIEHAVQRALAAARENGLIRYEDLPEPWRINPHIHAGYRFHEGKLECLRSVLSLSNETFNIWSHLIGFIVVLAVAFYFYPTSIHFSLSTKSDVFIAAIFFFAACKCLVCSTCWHTFNSISEQQLMERFACVDYTGISLLVAASIMTTEYTAFYCEPVSRWIYLCATAALGVGGVILPWHPTFNRQDMAWARVLFYTTLATTGFVPFFQLSMTRGLYWTMAFYLPVVKSVLIYFGGALLYAAKVPEVWFPGSVDYVGASHHIWHVAVVLGILFHYLAMQEFFEHAFQRARSQCSIY